MKPEEEVRFSKLTANKISKLLAEDKVPDELDKEEGKRKNNDNKRAVHAINTISWMLHKAEKDGNSCIDDMFNHEHYLYTCDGNGSFYVISIFTLATSHPGIPLLSAITTAVLRCHDNFRDCILMPTQAQYSVPFFQHYLKDHRGSSGLDFCRVPYALCSKIMLDCLERMRRSNKILQDKEARTIVRLFGLSSRTPFDRTLPVLPPPSPAPNVESLWMIVQRPDYYYFTFNEDLENYFQYGKDSQVIDRTKLYQAMRVITGDEYRRNRMYAMLEHMATWHTVVEEIEIASWLLWERATMMKFSNAESAIRAMESNLFFQLIINKFFKMGIRGMEPKLHDDKPDEYGSGVDNFFLFVNDWNERGTLPPNVFYTASVAKQAATTVDHDNKNGNNENGGPTISQLSKYLVSKRTNNCALCGATKARGTGKPLMKCSRCRSVAYCCKEHQKLHWKQGGHKQECMPE